MAGERRSQYPTRPLKGAFRKGPQMSDYRNRRQAAVVRRLLSRAVLSPEAAAGELGISVSKMELYCTGTVRVPRLVRLALKQVIVQELKRANRFVDEFLAS